MADVQITDLISEGVFASRPAAADAVEYYATDTKVRYYSDGAAWTAQPPTVETHVHSGADITSGTVVDARLDAALARDSEVTSAISTHAGLSDPHPGYTTAAELAAAKLDDFAAPDDNTDLNATTSAHGLLPKLGGGSTNYLRADGTWATPSGGGGTGLLAVQQYAPVADGNWTRTPATLADVDATNAAVTFTAPASGNVLIKAHFFVGAPSANRVGQVGLRVASSDVAGPYQIAYGASSPFYGMVEATFYVTGLTPTTSYTYKLAFMGDATAACQIFYGPVTGGSNPPFVMTVWTAP